MGKYNQGGMWWWGRQGFPLLPSGTGAIARLGAAEPPSPGDAHPPVVGAWEEDLCSWEMTWGRKLAVCSWLLLVPGRSTARHAGAVSTCSRCLRVKFLQQALLHQMYPSQLGEQSGPGSGSSSQLAWTNGEAGSKQ